MSEYGENTEYDRFLKEESKRREKEREEYEKDIRKKHYSNFYMEDSEG